MNKVKVNPSTMLNPVPVVMVTSKLGEKENIITIAWAGTINSEPPMLSISVRKNRYSYDIIKESGVFAVNAVSMDLIRSADYCGVKSGRDNDKFADLGLKKFYGESGVPMIEQSPFNIECRVKNIIELGSHDMFIAEITGVYFNENIMDKDGRADFTRANLSAYCHGEYYPLGKPEGFFGFSVAKKDVLKRRLKK